VPQRHEHLERAHQTEKLADALQSTLGVCIDWSITMLFYAGLHYIDAFLARKNMHPLDHSHRDEEIERNGSLSPIYPEYRRLKDLSRAARCQIPNFSEQTKAVAKNKLERIKSHLGNL
jgi:hypothetical protein